ncbi:MAG TPA: hypothetical protein VH440_13880 [Candidatus Limnocylindrales bacterium]|jgi:hypothetical protein
MHDDLIERRLRDALRGEGDRVALTITPAELERRWALRRRQAATRPMALLLAAAVGIGLVGVGAVVGGFFERSSDAPEPSNLAVVPPGPTPSTEPVVTPVPENLPLPSGPTDLPTLVDLLHSGPADAIVLAQASGPGYTAAMPDVAVSHPSSVDLGPVPVGDYQVEFGCLTKGGSSDQADLALVPVGTSSGPGLHPVGCNGIVNRSIVSGVRPSTVRLALPGTASWRLVVRVVNGSTAAGSTLTQPAAGPDEEVLIDAERPPAPPKPGGSAADEPVDVGQIKFRDRYVFRASCIGSETMAYHTGVYDPASPFVPDTTTVVPCDGLVHEMAWRPGSRPEPDVLVTAADGTAWRLLLTADPSPIGTARDGDGWSEVISSGPRFVADDLDEALVGRLTDGNQLARVVVSCQGGTSVDVAVSRGDQTGSLQAFTATCGDQPTTRIGEPFGPDENGGFTVDVKPHGRMWTAVTVQEGQATAGG